MLPLAHRLKLRLTELIDRDETYQMLKGQDVEFHSVQLAPEDEKGVGSMSEYDLQELPICVYVIKPDATWTVNKGRKNKECIR